MEADGFQKKTECELLFRFVFVRGNYTNTDEGDALLFFSNIEDPPEADCCCLTGTTVYLHSLFQDNIYFSSFVVF